MRLLHTADWHLGDRLRHVDRTADLQRAVECIAGYCRDEQVDVLLVAGDLFSELCRPDTFQAILSHLSDTFRPFLLSGGTIVAVTGNHDNPVFCETLSRAFQLAAPVSAKTGDLLPPGRLYLAVRPAYFRLSTERSQRTGAMSAQFVCLPYPRTTSYRTAARAAFHDLAGRNRVLGQAYQQTLLQLRSKLSPAEPAVLISHINALADAAPDLFRITAAQDVLVKFSLFTTGWSYAALGHIHRPQQLGGQPQIRYSGSIERLDLGEQHDHKSVCLLELEKHGLCKVPATLPLDATPMYDIRLRASLCQLRELRDHYPDAERALVRCHLEYRPGEDNLFEMLAEINHIFPRCYCRTWSALGEHSARTTSRNRASTRGSTAPADLGDLSPVDSSLQVPELVLEYLQRTLDLQDPDREALIALARQLVENTSTP